MQSSLLKSIPNIEHWFGHIGAEHGPFGLDWDQKKPHWKQIHGTCIKSIHTPHEEAGECDGLFTEKEDLPIAVVTADCVPILLARTDGSAVAALHAGWRGTLGKIAQIFFAQPEVGSPEKWVATVGPCISMKHYQVSSELLQDFKKEFSHYTPELFLNEPQRLLNLPALNILQLQEIGIHKVENIKVCTFEDMRFYSYRRAPGLGRQLSFIRRRQG